MSVHEVLCNDISMAVSVKCSRCKLQECNSSQGQEGKLQSFPVSTSLFLKERERIKQDHSQSRLMLIRTESESQSLKLNGISLARAFCSRLVPHAQKFHLRLSLPHLLHCWWRGERWALVPATEWDNLLLCPGYPYCWNTSRHDGVFLSDSSWKETEAWKDAKGIQNRGECFFSRYLNRKNGRRNKD